VERQTDHPAIAAAFVIAQSRERLDQLPEFGKSRKPLVPVPRRASRRRAAMTMAKSGQSPKPLESIMQPFMALEPIGSSGLARPPERTSAAIAHRTSDRSDPT
jgi:hypothetical protein